MMTWLRNRRIRKLTLRIARKDAELAAWYASTRRTGYAHPAIEVVLIGEIAQDKLELLLIKNDMLDSERDRLARRSMKLQRSFEQGRS